MRVSKADASELLYFDSPARSWDQALPLGNAGLGAMVWGGIDSERIDLNEESLWSGFPRDEINYEAQRYLAPVRSALAEQGWWDAHDLVQKGLCGHTAETFQPLGTLFLRMNGTGLDVPANYRRSLHLGDGLAESSWKLPDGHVERRCFISQNFKVMVYRLRTSIPEIQQGGFVPEFLCPHPHRFLSESKGSFTLTGRLPSRVLENYMGSHPEPVIYEEGRGLVFGLVAQTVSAPDGWALILAAASNYSGPDCLPEGGADEILEICASRVDRALAHGLGRVEEDHLEDQGRALGSFGLDFTETGKGKSTCQSFHMGRYLLNASSRSLMPANLQGIWNPHVEAPWGSNYTLNINTEMNYWPAEPAGPVVATEPLFRFVEALAEKGRRVARIHYSCRGWCAHHNSDLWAKASPVSGDPSWAFWPMAGAWLARHFWEHYLFGLDKDFLAKRAWPLMRDAALFVLDWSRWPVLGRIEFAPSSSPENLFLDADGRKCGVGINSALDLSLARDLWTNCLAAARILEPGDALSTQLLDELAPALAALPWPQIGEDGSILEWDRPYPMPEPGHRHLSPLYGLYPAALFLDSPKWMSAAQRTLELRLEHGGGATGWSAAWAAALYARLGNGEAAHDMVHRLVNEQSLPNLMSTHPPFQIDGNFGLTAAVCEMLVQSHAGFIDLLPALPRNWPRGRISGIRARGGLSLSMAWDEGRPRVIELRGRPGMEQELGYAGARRIITLDKKGEARMDDFGA